MKRFILTATLAWLLAGCAQPGVRTSTGAADPQAAVPATRYQPAIDARGTPAATADAGQTIPLHEHHAGMDMQGMQCMAGSGQGKGCCAGMHDAGHAAHGAGMAGMQCMAGGKCGCCAGKDKTNAHANHAGMAMGDGCCCGHDAAAGQPAACKPGGTCGCCHHEEAT
jgi:hypothetical protein